VGVKLQLLLLYFLTHLLQACPPSQKLLLLRLPTEVPGDVVPMRNQVMQRLLAAVLRNSLPEFQALPSGDCAVALLEIAVHGECLVGVKLQLLLLYFLTHLLQACPPSQKLLLLRLPTEVPGDAVPIRNQAVQRLLAAAQRNWLPEFQALPDGDCGGGPLEIVPLDVRDLLLLEVRH